MNSRTVREFYVPTDITHIVEKWAADEGFQLKGQDGNKRRYQKGTGLLVLPTIFEITIDGSMIHFETWIHASIVNRVFSLFLLPEEIKVESGGFRAVIPRTVSRDRINRLMTQIGQPLIS